MFSFLTFLIRFVLWFVCFSLLFSVGVGAGGPAGRVWQAEGTLLRSIWVPPMEQEALEEQSRLRSKVEVGSWRTCHPDLNGS